MAEILRHNRSETRMIARVRARGTGSTCRDYVQGLHAGVQASEICDKLMLCTTTTTTRTTTTTTTTTTISACTTT